MSYRRQAVPQCVQWSVSHRLDRVQPETLRVLVLIDCTTGEGRETLSSVIRHISARPEWRLCLPPGPDEMDVLHGQNLRRLLDAADTALIRVFDEALIRRLTACGKPIVSLVSRYADEVGVPTVTTDGSAIATAAVEHLVERLFPHLGFVGFSGLHWHRVRHEAVAAAAARRGCQFHAHLVDQPLRYGTDLIPGSAPLRAWLVDVPKPIGIVAADDRVGFQLVQTCLDLGLRVPRDVAIVGGGNDDTICNAAAVPLSSVDTGLRQVGDVACRTLGRLLEGKRVERTQKVPPAGVVLRASTDIVASQDEVVAEALHQIRRLATSGLTAEALAASLPLSRSGFEKRFRAATGRSPRVELERVRVEEAKKLLLATDATLDVIAHQSGFTSPQRFYAAFKHATNLTPRQFFRLAVNATEPRTQGRNHIGSCSIVRS
jgi:LacI family transcriptional regulator